MSAGRAARIRSATGRTPAVHAFIYERERGGVRLARILQARSWTYVHTERPFMRDGDMRIPIEFSDGVRALAYAEEVRSAW